MRYLLVFNLAWELKTANSIIKVALTYCLGTISILEFDLMDCFNRED